MFTGSVNNYVKYSTLYSERVAVFFVMQWQHNQTSCCLMYVLNCDKDINQRTSCHTKSSSLGIGPFQKLKYLGQ